MPRVSRTTVRPAYQARRQVPRAAEGKPPGLLYLQVPWSTLEALENKTQTLVRSTHFRRGRMITEPRPGYVDLLPCPVVVWAVHPSILTIQRMRMMTVTENYLQPLTNADEYEIRQEGFADRDSWREHWMATMDSYFDPLALSEVYVFRDYEPVDTQVLADRMIQDMFGPYLDGRSHDRHLPAPQPTRRRPGGGSGRSPKPAGMPAPEVLDAA